MHSGSVAHVLLHICLYHINSVNMKYMRESTEPECIDDIITMSSNSVSGLPFIQLGRSLLACIKPTIQKLGKINLSERLWSKRMI